MPIKQTDSHTMLKRVVAPLTVWAVTKALETPRVKKTMSRVDQKFHDKRKKAKRSVARASENAMNNRMWLAAGLAAIVTGIGLMTKATRRS